MIVNTRKNVDLNLNKGGLFNPFFIFIMRRREYNIDWKRNNKIAIRNPHEECDFHDIVKLLLVRMLRRKYKNSSTVPIYTEFSPEENCDTYPDVWMKVREKLKPSTGNRTKSEWVVYAYEIQKNITKKWLKETIKRYENVNLIIVPLNDLPKDLTKLKKELEKYIV